MPTRADQSQAATSEEVQAARGVPGTAPRGCLVAVPGPHSRVESSKDLESGAPPSGIGWGIHFDGVVLMKDAARGGGPLGFTGFWSCPQSQSETSSGILTNP